MLNCILQIISKFYCYRMKYQLANNIGTLLPIFMLI